VLVVELEGAGEGLESRRDFLVLEGSVESSRGCDGCAACVEADGGSPLVLDHVGEQRLLQAGVRRAQRVESSSPADDLDVGGSAGLLEATDPNPTAGMIGWTVLAGD
jgi:hypothetical protein